MNIKHTVATGLFALAASLLAAPASATISFSGSGAGEAGGTVSGQADFSLSGGILTLILTNTSGSTAAQGNTITGIVFSITGGATLAFDMTPPTCGQSLSGSSVIWTSSSLHNTSGALCGSWTSVLAASPPIPAEFGVATTGFNGEFNGGSITLGNASPNYGIIGGTIGTFPGAFGGSQFPFIQNALQFQFTVTGSMSESDINGVNFLVGTAGTNSFVGGCTDCVQHESPEPDSLALVGLAGLLLAFTARRRAAS